jgi:hypothetical protein
LAEEVKEIGVVAIVMEDLLPGIASVEDVIAISAHNGSRGTWHSACCVWEALRWPDGTIPRFPIHAPAGDTQPTFSAHLGKQIFQCFHADCRAQGNVLDLWAAVHQRPLYEAALHLAETFQLPRNREEEPVGGTR